LEKYDTARQVTGDSILWQMRCAVAQESMSLYPYLLMLLLIVTLKSGFESVSTFRGGSGVQHPSPMKLLVWCN